MVHEVRTGYISLREKIFKDLTQGSKNGVILCVFPRKPGSTAQRDTVRIAEYAKSRKKDTFTYNTLFLSVYFVFSDFLAIISKSLATPAPELPKVLIGSEKDILQGDARKTLLIMSQKKEPSDHVIYHQNIRDEIRKNIDICLADPNLIRRIESVIREKADELIKPELSVTDKKIIIQTELFKQNQTMIQ